MGSNPPTKQQMDSKKCVAYLRQLEGLYSQSELGKVYSGVHRSKGKNAMRNIDTFRYITNILDHELRDKVLNLSRKINK